jgi:hypothetical protein
MIKKVVTPTNEKEKEDKKKAVVVPVKATKSSKVQAAMAPRFGLRKSQVQRMFNDAETTFESWRKDGFRGAWWKRYFKNDAASD